MNKVVCQNCEYCQPPFRVNLFGPGEMVTEKGFEAQREGDLYLSENQSREEDLFYQRVPFPFMPRHYPWCYAMTPCEGDFMLQLDDLWRNGQVDEAHQLRVSAGGRAAERRVLIKRARQDDQAALQALQSQDLFDYAHNEIREFYAVCQLVNDDNHCPLFQKREDGSLDGPRSSGNP